MWTQMRTAVVLLLVLTVLTGVAYPLVITGVAAVAFPEQARGSLVVRHGQVIGSVLIGQNFREARYFHPRPSAAGEGGYDAAASGGSNLGPTSRALVDRVRGLAEELGRENPTRPAPVDLVTASGSGLDPHITPAAAVFQAGRVARARGLSEEAVRRLVRDCTEGRQWGVLGEPRVNVLRLNLALDGLAAGGAQ